MTNWPNVATRSQLAGALDGPKGCVRYVAIVGRPGGLLKTTAAKSNWSVATPMCFYAREVERENPQVPLRTRLCMGQGHPRQSVNVLRDVGVD